MSSENDKYEIKNVKDFQETTQIDPITLPKILVTDPMCTTCNLKHGDVVLVDGDYYFVF